MSIRRFLAASHKDAMRQVRDALGDDAVIVLSRKTAQGAEIFAIAEAELLQLSDTTAPSTNGHQASSANASAIAGSDFSQVAQQLLSDVQDMRAMLHQQQGLKVPDDNKRKLYRKMRAGGYSDELARQLVALLPVHLNHSAKQLSAAQEWLEQQLGARISHHAGTWDLLEHQGVLALVGPTGVGKTTTTAKLAAHYVMRHGHDSLLLVTTDSYRIGAQQQLAIYAELLNVEMHALAEGDTMNSLQEKMQGKRLVLVDTVGMSQRDQRLAQKIAALGADDYKDSTRVVLLLNAASQPETLAEVATIYQRLGTESGLPVRDCVLTKLDESALLGGVLDTVIRHKLTIQSCSVGQRVPEDIQAPDIVALISQSLADEVNESVLAQAEWEQPMATGLAANQVISQGSVIQSSIQALRAQLAGFTEFEQAWRTQQWPSPLQAMAFTENASTAAAAPPLLRWAAPQPLQGWQHRTPHLALNADGSPQLPAVLQQADELQPDYQLAPVQLFDYLPATTLLEIFIEHGTGWLVSLNLNHKLSFQGAELAAVDLVKKHAIPLTKQNLLYRGEMRRLELRIAAADSHQADAPYQVVYGELHGGSGKNPVQRRYWMLDSRCSAEQLVVRVKAMLQSEEYSRLTRLAWQELKATMREAGQPLQLLLAGTLAAAALQLEYSQHPEAAHLRGELLSLTGKRGRVQGDKLVPGMLRVLQAHQALVAAGRQAGA